MRPAKLLLFVTAALGLIAMTGLASGETVQKGKVRIGFEGELSPQRLPRERSVPVRVSVGAKIATIDGSPPPRLRKISIAINRAGRFNIALLPACTVADIQPSTTEKALEACGESVVGSGSFAAKLLYPEQAAFPSAGKLVAFNGRYNGHPAILAHVYGTVPVPTSFTLPFLISERKGQLGTVLTASLASITGTAGYITELGLDLGATVGSGNHRKGFLEASCPAPKGFTVATFPFARASFDFGSREVSSTLNRKCEVRG